MDFDEAIQYMKNYEKDILNAFLLRIRTCKQLLQVDYKKGDEEFVMLHPRLAAIKGKVKRRKSIEALNIILQQLKNDIDNPQSFFQKIELAFFR